MLVSEIMTDRVKAINANATLLEAAKAMDDLNIGALPVLHDDRLIGIITDRDIVIRSTSAGQDPNMTKVRDAMTAPAIYCWDDQSVEEAAEVMQREKIRRLPILDRTSRLVGILTLDDLLVDIPDQTLSSKIAHSLSIPIKAAS